jgi:AcrR family transcriptional regulator
MTKALNDTPGQGGEGPPPKRLAQADHHRRQKRGEDTRERILEAASREFALHGLEGASIRAIARRAGVSHTRFVYYFDSKDGLWQAVAQRTTDRLYERYAVPMSQADKVSKPELLKLLWAEYIRYTAENPDVSWIMSHVAREGSADEKWRMDKYVRPAYVRTADLIQAAQASGEFIEGDPHHLHYLFLGAASRIFMLRGEVEKLTELRLGDPQFVEDHIRTCLALFFRTPGEQRKSPAYSPQQPSPRSRRREKRAG